MLLEKGWKKRFVKKVQGDLSKEECLIEGEFECGGACKKVVFVGSRVLFGKMVRIERNLL